MSVYIPGMEMPTSCDECKFKTVTGLDRWKCCIFKSEFMSWDAGWGNETTRHKGCPLVPVPPHGRLIDADAELERLKHCMFPSDMVTTTAVGMYEEWLKNAPTIIPADEEAEK